MNRRRPVLLVTVGLVMGACGGGPTLTEYAGEVELIVQTMNSRLDATEIILDNETQTLGRIRAYADDRVAARKAFLAGFEELDPPSEATDMHTAALDVIRNLVSAEQELFDPAHNSDDIVEVSALWATPSGQAARAADAKAVALCQAAEQALNSTEERQQLAGLPWVPSELQEVVTVAFGCLPEDR